MDNISGYDVIFKKNILDILHAAYLTGKYEEVKTRPRQRIHGRRDFEISEILSIDINIIMEAAKKLQAEALIDIAPHDSNKMLTLTGLGIEKLSFQEKISQMKSEVYIQMLATILEESLKDVDKKDEKNWKNKIFQIAERLATKSAEVALSAVISTSIK